MIPWNIIIPIVLFIFVLVTDLATDISRWKSGRTIDHKRGAVIRIIGLFPVIMMLGWFSIPLVLFLYWFLFDGFFNKLRKMDWWFVGSDDQDDAYLDNFIEQLKPIEHKLMKLGGIFFGIVLFTLK